MAELSVGEVKAILEAQGIRGIGEDDLVATTLRLNALMDGLDRLEESESFGDVESWVLFDPVRTSD